MSKKLNILATAMIAAVLFCATASAQKAEVAISLNEAFFDAVLDSMYKNFDPPQFSLAAADLDDTDADSRTASYSASVFSFPGVSRFSDRAMRNRFATKS